MEEDQALDMAMGAAIDQAWETCRSLLEDLQRISSDGLTASDRDQTIAQAACWLVSAELLRKATPLPTA